VKRSEDRLPEFSQGTVSSGKAPPAGWNGRWPWGLILVVVTFLAYLPVWRAGFIWDDDSFLVNNPLIKDPRGLHGFWCTTAAPDYFPMTSSTLWLEWRLWGAHPLGYHLVNVLLHALSAVLWWRLLLRLFPQPPAAAWLAAALFALHPVNVESVAWITERKNTLAMVFFVLTLLGYLRFELTGRRLWYGLALGSFVLALLSKTAVVPLPLVLLALAWWQRHAIGRRDLGRALPFFAIALALGCVTLWFQSHRAIGTELVRTDSLASRLAAAGWAIWFYLGKALWPLDLSFIYPRWQIHPDAPLSYLPALLLVLALGWAWHYRRRGARPWFFALGYFIVMLLPVLGFLNIYFMRYSLVADHWQYFSIMGILALVAGAVTRALRWVLPSNPLLRPLACAALLAILGALTWRQCGIYADAETLWQKTLARNPGSAMVQNNLGNALLQTGRASDAIACFQKALEIEPDDAEARNNLGTALLQQGRVDEALSQFQLARQSQPNFPGTYYNLGVALTQKGLVDQAIAAYQQAVQLKPDYAVAHNNLGLALAHKGQLDQARLHYQLALDAEPDDALAHGNLGDLLLQQGKLDQALDHFQKALDLQPRSAQAHYNLANALLQAGQPDQAILHYQQALDLDPNYAQACVNLGNVLVQKANLPQALVQYRRALALRPDLAQAHDNLGLVLVQLGQFEEALDHYAQAARLEPQNPLPELLAARACLRRGQSAQAIPHLRSALLRNPDDLQSLAQLARLLASDPDPALRDGPEALRLARRANALSGVQVPFLLDTLAMAYAESGRFTDAQQTLQLAIQLATAAGDNDALAAMRPRLQLYRSDHPFRESHPQAPAGSP